MPLLKEKSRPSGTTTTGKSVGSARERLVDAFFRLLDLKPFQDITVTELTTAAGVHRSSFYANFGNTFELLAASKEEAMRRLFKSFPKDEETSEVIDRAHLIPFLKFVKAHPNWYRAYKKNGPIFGEKNDFAYATSFCLGGIDSVINLWMDNGFVEPEEEIAALIEAFAPSRILK